MRIFLKFFYVISFFLASFCFQVNAEVVKKIEITGNERISKETIVIFGDISLGADYQKKDINLLIKKLYETQFFENVSVELANNKLNISVKENPIINTIVFKGEKAKKFKENLSKLIRLQEKGSFLQNYIKSDINIIKEFYRNLGFYFVTIEAEVEKLDRNI